MKSVYTCHGRFHEKRVYISLGTQPWVQTAFGADLDCIALALDLEFRTGIAGASLVKHSGWWEHNRSRCGFV